MRHRCKLDMQMSSTVCVFLIYLANSVTCQIFDDPNMTVRWLKSVTDGLETELVENIVRKSTAAEKLTKIYADIGVRTTTLDSNEILMTALNKATKIFKTAEELVEALATEAEKINKESRAEKSELTLTGEQVAFYQKSANQTHHEFNQVPLPSTSVTGRDVIEKENVTLHYYNAKCGCEENHQTIQLEDKGYVDCFKPPTEFSSNKLFSNQNITLSTSSIHIPVDVYNEGSDVLKDVAWTKDLEPLLNDSLCNASLNGGRTKWVYIATLNGVMRYFPSSEWNVPCGEIDFYDARSTPWFVQSMSSPKDVLVMVDTSGSIIGLTLDLIHLSVHHVMSSLSNNDFFNIFVFNENATFLNPTCPGLLQATPLNKELALSWMATIEPKSKSSFHKGFEFAFDILSEENSTSFRSSAKTMRAACNPLILLFTDGGAEYPDAVFKKWNLDKHTRIFSYSVGKHFSSTASLKDMACNNRGVFLPVPSDSATHIQTMEYLAKLSKPMAFSTMKTNKWTLPYEDHLGLGTIMSVSRPIYNNFIQRPSHKHVLGVAAIAGTDILYSDIARSFDTSKWGAAAYMFGLENNGHLFYHPGLKKARLNSPVTVDISDIEPMDISKIRRSMIDKTSGRDVALRREMLSQDGRHLTSSAYRYSYAEIPGCDFSVALALPSNGFRRLDASQTLDSARLSYQTDDILLPGIYSAAYGLQCEQSEPKKARACDINNSFNSGNTTSPPSALLEDIVRLSLSCDPSGGDKEQVDELFLQGLATRRLADLWSRSSNVEAVFVATDSKPSLLRIKQYGSEEHVQQKIISALSPPSNKDYFLRALLSSPTTIFSLLQFDPDDPVIPSTPSGVTDSYTTPGVTTGSYERSTSASSIPKIKYFVASEAVAIGPDDRRIHPAVTGAVLPYEDIKETFWNKTIQQAEDLCSDAEECLNSYNCWYPNLTCAILDDGGMLFVTNQDKHQDKVGTFFGEIDGELMMSMENDGLYTSRDVYDHQVVCKVVPKSHSSGPGNFRSPTLATLLDAGWWMTSTLWLIIQNLAIGVIYVVNSALAGDVNDAWGIPFSTEEYISPNSNSMNRHCVLKTKVFSYGLETSVSNGEAECNRTYTAMRIPNTNLLFVISQMDENSCSSPYSSTNPIHEDVTEKMPRPSERYRVQPNGGKCYEAKSLPFELDTDCGTACSCFPNYILVFCSAAFLLSTMTLNP